MFYFNFHSLPGVSTAGSLRVVNDRNGILLQGYNYLTRHVVSSHLNSYVAHYK
jgi:hypothetical protein